jgi:GTP-binding protein
MSLPTVVIAGRPNVGKSTLFNRLVGRRHAIVSDTPGVTRDRKDAQAMLRGRLVRLVDTAGLEESAPETLFGRMRASSEAAVDQADLVVFVVDARSGITPPDEHFANWLRRRNHPVLLVANKAEGRSGSTAALEAYSLGLGEPLPVSAEHGEGIAELMSEIADRLPPEPEDEAGEGTRPLKLAIVGRPNAGKSTLVNRLVGEDRMITGPEPGLTRDAVSVILNDPEGGVELVDTAGLRKRARIELPLEKMSVSASIEALKMAEVVALTIDATEGLHEQDLQIGRLIEREGRACVLVLNKWDAVEDRQKQRQAISDRLETSLTQMRGIPVVTVSALTGAGIEKLLPVVRRAYTVWNMRVPTGELNRWFEKALERHQPPMVEGRRLKLRYVTQAKARPPTFLVFGTRAEQMPEEYQRYLVNSLREQFDMPGTPVRIQLRGTKNPYADVDK